jgi:dipeptidyl aminopeptidase/acylaminoacyl peptidase
VQCKPQKVSFETFDKLSAPGEAGTLHAYLLLPRHPRSQSELRGLVLSFYGGYNAYSQQFQILCEAGYVVLSPAPRGTTDFGEAFYNLAAGDWGGAETLDGFAAGRFLAARLQLPPTRIGIFGGSRGGYDALRALTFPGEVNGIREDFRFGFGVSNFGISDIARAAEGGNISQWYAMLTAGSPKSAPEKWRERSPETHAALLSAPLLLTHGTNDNRVPVIESRSMYEKARSLGKDVTYVEFPGQGHGYKGVESLALYYRTLLEFLDRLR